MGIRTDGSRMWLVMVWSLRLLFAPTMGVDPGTGVLRDLVEAGNGNLLEVYNEWGVG
jgi:hypothetical protein